MRGRYYEKNYVYRTKRGRQDYFDQAMKGNTITYHKTQYVNHYDVIIDTPGEYLQSKNLISALAVFTAEADVIGLLMDATEPFSLYSPNLTPVCNREVVGVVTKIDHWAAQPAQAAAWLELAGCKKIFYTSAYTGEGIADILSYLKEERDTLPWEEVKSKYDELGFGAGEDAKDQNRFHNI